jgi:hypothetical protein
LSIVSPQEINRFNPSGNYSKIRAVLGMGHISAVAPPREGDYIIRACFDTYPATGTKFSLEIEADRDTILHLVDLFIGDRVEREKLKSVDWAGNYAIVAPGTPICIYMYCKSHDITQISYGSVVDLKCT